MNMLKSAFQSLKYFWIFFSSEHCLLIKCRISIISKRNVVSISLSFYKLSNYKCNRCDHTHGQKNQFFFDSLKKSSLWLLNREVWFFFHIITFCYVSFTTVKKCFPKPWKNIYHVIFIVINLLIHIFSRFQKTFFYGC